MKIPNLPLTVIGHEIETLPTRKVKLKCRVSNPTESPICLLDAWVRIEALNDLLLAEGKYFQLLHNLVDPAVIPTRDAGLGVLHIELPNKVLQSIEERRSGGDVKLTITSRVLVSVAAEAGTILLLGIPYETQFGDVATDRFEYLIPQSEWLKLLKALSWSEIEILELPSGMPRAIPSLNRALQRFEDAQQCYRRGDWEESMLNCRKAFEALVQDAAGKQDMSKAHDAFVSILGEGEKTNRVEKVAKELGGFLHLGRHENLPDVSIKKADAEFALILTGALMVYLGQNA